MTPRERRWFVVLPLMLALIAVSLADLISPPDGAETMDNLERDVTAILIGAGLGAIAAWILYGPGSGGKSG